METERQLKLNLWTVLVKRRGDKGKTQRKFFSLDLDHHKYSWTHRFYMNTDSGPSYLSALLTVLSRQLVSMLIKQFEIQMY